MFKNKTNSIDLSKIRERIGCSQETLARIVGVSSRTISRWETTSIEPRQIAFEKINCLEELKNLMKRRFNLQQGLTWVNSQNHKLNNKRPIDLLKQGFGGLQKVLDILR